MNTQRFALASAYLAGAILLVGSLSTLAQQAVDPTPRTANAPADTSNAARGLGKLDAKTTGATVRVSKLIGANLKNSNDESVGEIKDLVVDATTGKVRYAAVTYGGFLGLGSKLFAVPFEAFRVRQNTSALTPGDYTLTLDVTKDQLQGAQGFDNDHWPDFANASFTQELDRRYKIDRGETRR